MGLLFVKVPFRAVCKNRARSACKIWLYTCLASSSLFSPLLSAEEPKTPLAGEEFHSDLFGQPVDVLARDRRHILAIAIGGQWIPKGPNELEVLPFGALFVWKNEDTRRFRGTFSGVYNDIRYNLGSKQWDGWEAVVTFTNFVVPAGRSE